MAGGINLGSGIVDMTGVPTYSEAAAYAESEDPDGFFRWLISMGTSCTGEDMDLNDIMEDYIRENRMEILHYTRRQMCGAFPLAAK